MHYLETYEGREFTLNEQQAQKLTAILEMVNPPKFIDINGRKIAVNSIAGIFSELDMREKEYRKQGMFICAFGFWHEFKGVCNCGDNHARYGIWGTAPASKALIDFAEAKGLSMAEAPEKFSISGPLPAQDLFLDNQITI